MMGKGGKGAQTENTKQQLDQLVSEEQNSDKEEKKKQSTPVARFETTTQPLGVSRKKKDMEQTILDKEIVLDQHVMAELTPGNWVVSQVLKIRISKKDGNNEYYVHFEEFNRRMDRWVERSQIQLSDPKVDQFLRKQQQKQKERKASSSNKRQNQEDQKNLQTFFNNNQNFGLNDTQVQEHQSMTKIKTITNVQFGKFKSQAWYYSPYPAHCQDIDTLYICSNCLNFWPRQGEYSRHIKRCKLTFPPGDQIYRDDKLSMFEVDGRQQQIYCENLAYMAKLFLDHKYLKFDTTPFLFYILTQWNGQQLNMVGYFSKEKCQFFEENKTSQSKGKSQNNLSCILVMPFHQKKGYGKFLVDFSYKLSLIEKRPGTPQRPLSDLGHKLYTSYWGYVLITEIMKCKDQNMSIQDLKDQTGIIEADIQATLKELNILQYLSGGWLLVADDQSLNKKIKSFGRPSKFIDIAKIRWSPYSKS